MMHVTLGSSDINLSDVDTIIAGAGSDVRLRRRVADGWFRIESAVPRVLRGSSSARNWRYLLAAGEFPAGVKCVWDRHRSVLRCESPVLDLPRERAQVLALHAAKGIAQPGEVHDVGTLTAEGNVESMIARAREGGWAINKTPRGLETVELAKGDPRRATITIRPNDISLSVSLASIDDPSPVRRRALARFGMRANGCYRWCRFVVRDQGIVCEIGVPPGFTQGEVHHALSILAMVVRETSAEWNALAASDSVAAQYVSLQSPGSRQRRRSEGQPTRTSNVAAAR